MVTLPEWVALVVALAYLWATALLVAGLPSGRWWVRGMAVALVVLGVAGCALLVGVDQGWVVLS